MESGRTEGAGAAKGGKGAGRSMGTFFPRGSSPRQAQLDLLGRIEEATKSGYRHIVVCAPTGLGKSHVAVAFARWHGSSSIVTAQKVLQDQYMRDFGFLSVAKGKSNYPCIALCESAGIPHSDGVIRDKSATCGHGACTWKYDGKIKHCRYKPKMSDFEVGRDGHVFEPVAGSAGRAPGEAWAAMRGSGTASAAAAAENDEGGSGSTASNMCYYYIAKYKAMLARHSLYNYAAYVHFYRFGPDEMRRDCLVADEAHEIEDILADYAACSVQEGELAAAGAGTPAIPAGEAEAEIDTDDLLDTLKALAVHHTQAMRAAGRGNGAAHQMHAVLAERYGTIRTEVKRNPGNVAAMARKDGNGRALVEACILNVSWLARRLFDTPCQLYMSATIHPDVFCPAMGIDRRDCAYIEVERSSFPPENRPVHYLDTVRLNSASGAGDMEAAYGEVARLLAMHPHEKGIVHTTSIRQCNELCAAVGDARETIQVYGAAPMERDEALRHHMESPAPTVLVSPGLWNGVDLAGNASRFQVVLKAPYPSMADMRTVRMAAASQLWYRYRAMARLIQGIGRSVRSEDDYAVTYVVDGSASRLMRSLRKYVPKAYADTLVPPDKDEGGNSGNNTGSGDNNSSGDKDGDSKR